MRSNSLLAFAALLFLSSTLADKAVEKNEKKSAVADIKKIIKKVDAAIQQTADKRIDTVDEKSDIVEAAASSSYEAGAPVSQGNLYYYYYPVAAYPVHADDKVSGSSSGSSLTDSPLVFILVPLVLLLIAVPVISLLLNNNSGRSFGSRSSALDEKFGSFEELQEAIDLQLSKYMSALDSERCMDRIVCELGVKASNIPHKNLFFSVVEWIAPEHGLLGYGRMTILKQAAEGNYSMNSCRKFVCNPPASIQQTPKH